MDKIKTTSCLVMNIIRVRLRSLKFNNRNETRKKNETKKRFNCTKTIFRKNLNKNKNNCQITTRTKNINCTNLSAQRQ